MTATTIRAMAERVDAIRISIDELAAQLDTADVSPADRLRLDGAIRIAEHKVESISVHLQRMLADDSRFF